MKYQWKITKDHIADLSEPAPSNCNAVGMFGPRGYDGSMDSEMTWKFQMFDDDGELYYEGVQTENAEDAPLYDFGLPNAGCTIIKHFVKGKFETVYG